MCERNEGQISFLLTFEGQLNPDDRWIKLALIVSWEEIEDLAADSLQSFQTLTDKEPR